MNTSTPSNYPDIEIYISGASISDVLNWLKDIYRDIELVKTVNAGKSQNFLASNPGDAQKTPILIVEDARDNFSCVWFQSANAPWPTDLECALIATEHFSSEIRCSTGSWSEAPVSDEWFSIQCGKQTLIHWSS